jgi:hypothetical protein
VTIEFALLIIYLISVGLKPDRLDPQSLLWNALVVLGSVLTIWVCGKMAVRLWKGELVVIPTSKR